MSPPTETAFAYDGLIASFELRCLATQSRPNRTSNSAILLMNAWSTEEEREDHEPLDEGQEPTRRRLLSPLRIAILLVLVAVVYGATWVPGMFRRGLKDPLTALPAHVTGKEYISASACRDCHKSQHASWHKTYHRTMTQKANDESILGDFDDVELEYIGLPYRLTRRGDEYWVNMPDYDWLHEKANAGQNPRKFAEPPMVDRRIIMTTGSHHFQGYWVATSDGKHLRQLPFYYHIDEKRWLPKVRRFLGPDVPEDYDLTFWNFRCLQCHTTGANPGKHEGKDVFSTQVVDLGIGCESCHGPGVGHMARHQKKNGNKATLPDDMIVHPRKSSAKISNDICGQCHSVTKRRDPEGWLTSGSPFRPGDDLSESDVVQRFEHMTDDDPWRPYWSDEKFRCGGREYNAVTESPCATGGEFSCVSCHSLHDSDPDGLMRKDITGNQLCLQCHESIGEDLAGHTHHKAGSSGSQCQNCHMPRTSFALMSALPSHSIGTPNVTANIKGAAPNACNLCHLDQTLEWSSQHLTSWTGGQAVEFGDDEKTIAASLLWLSQGDGVQRAITSWHFGWKPAQEASGSEWMTPFLVNAMNGDNYAGVRYLSGKSLRSLPNSELGAFDFLAPNEQRRQETRQTLTDWLNRDWQPDPQQAKRLLMDPSGAPLWPELGRLIERRDNTPIFLPE